MNVNCLMVGIENPKWLGLLPQIRDKYIDYINKDKCHEQFMNLFYEDTPHITLMYGFDDQPDPNSLFIQARIICRDLFNQLEQVTHINPEELTIDEFRNDDAIVLKVNCSAIKAASVLKKYNEFLRNKYGCTSEYKEYNPHITLTYLNSDIPNEVLKSLKDELQVLLKDNVIKDFIMGDEDHHNVTFKF